jgi:hypothetical protein
MEDDLKQKLKIKKMEDDLKKNEKMKDDYKYN